MTERDSSALSPLLAAALAGVLAASGVPAAAHRHGGQGANPNQGGYGSPGGYGNQGSNNGQHPNGGPAASANAGGASVDTSPVVSAWPAETEEKPPQKMTRADARLDFQTVVQTFVEQNSVDGLWPYRAGGGTWRLQLVKFDVKSIKKAGRDRYAGAVVLREGNKLRVFRFVVDFSGADWKVVSAKPLEKPRKAPPAVKSGAP